MWFPKRLRQLRLEHHMTQADLSELLNRKSSAISKYECGLGQPNLEQLAMLAEIFDVSIDYLIGVSEIRARDGTALTLTEADMLTKYRKLSTVCQARINERIESLRVV